MKRLVLGLVVILGLFAPINVLATDYSHTSGVQTVTATGVYAQITDPEYWHYAYTWTDKFYNRRIQNKVKLNIDRSNLDYVGPAITLQVTIKMETDKLVGGSVSTQPAFYKTVNLVYNPSQTAIEVDQVVLTYDDVVKSKATVTAVTVIGSTALFPTPGSLPVFNIENILEISRVKGMDLDPIHYANQSISKTDANTNGKYQKVTMSWPADTGAEAYELEFTFINDPVSRGPYPTPLSNTTVDFSKRSTRIRISGSNSYSIPIFLPEGFLVFRVRALGEKLSADVVQTAKLWSLPDVADLDLINLDGDCSIEIDNYQDSINWSFSITYAEEGKYSEALVWFDGMLRVRQSLAMDNETGLPMIAANIFDYLGRETVQAMASPFFDDSGYDYRAKVNQNINNAHFTYGDFDINYYDNVYTTSLTDELHISRMGKLYGANYYYSDEFDSDLQSSSYSSEEKRRHSFLPDAGGYAFSQTELTNDGTGRVARSGSVGKTHQLTGFHNSIDLVEGKETKTWDATPFQEELDKLFGAEVGHYSNYKKVMTQDQNGQLSVAYLDLFGRTVATALAGVPENTPSLEPISSSEYTTEYDLFLENTVSNLNEKKVKHGFAVTQLDTWEFRYNFKPQIVSYGCDENFCYGCAYDLTIDVLDQWGNSMLDTGAITSYVGSIVDSMSCDTPGTFTFTPDPIEVILDKGEYTLVKTLTFSKLGMDTAWDYYLTQSGCVKPFVEFLTEELNAMDITCELSCEQCDVQLVDLEELKDSIKAWCITNIVDTAAHQDYLDIKEELAELEEICAEICTETSSCDLLYEQMLSDVSLGGQYMRYFTLDDYGNVEDTIGESAFDSYVKSILLENWWSCTPGETVTRSWRRPDPFELSEANRHYKKEDGTEAFILVIDGYPEVEATASYVTIDGKQYARPHELKYVRDFVKFWRLNWAESLVYMHPEYCYYQKCLDIEDTYEYDAKLMATNSAEEAQEKGYYNPLDMSSLGSIQSQNIDYSSLETGTIERDPITSASYYSTASPTFQYELSNYTYKMPNGSGGCSTVTKSIWEIYEEYRVSQGITANVFSQDTCIEDVFWPILRGLYLSAKQQWLKSYYTSECPNGTACTDEVPQSLIDVDRWEGAADISLLTEIDADLSGLTGYCESDSFKKKVNNQTASQCQTNCEQNVKQWLEWLSGCDQITSLTPTELDSLTNDLERLCMSGCDSDHPFGSINRSPANRFNSQYPEANLHDVFLKHLGSNWFEEGVCDDLLIQFPGYYGHDYLATDDPDANECVCDSVKWHTTSSCPDLIVEDSLHQNECGCSYPNDLAMAKWGLRKVHVSEKCQNCVTCKDLTGPVYDFLQRYDTVETKMDSMKYQDLMTTWLNRDFGFNLTYEEYARFAYSCVDTAVDTTWSLIWSDIGSNRLVVLNDNQNIDLNTFTSPYQYAGTSHFKKQPKANPVIEVYDLDPLVRMGLASKRPMSSETVSLNEGLAAEAMSPQRSQAVTAAQIACHCEKILAVNHVIDQGNGGSLTANQLYDSMYGAGSFPGSWNFTNMKNACCKLWNVQPSDPPGPCTPIDFTPGMTYNTPKITHINNDLGGVYDPNLDLFEDPPCTPEPSVDVTQNYIDTCGCKEIQQIKEDHVAYLNSSPGPTNPLSLEAFAQQQLGFAIDNIDILLAGCLKMWGTGERKNGSGQTTGTYNSSSNWSTISNTNLEEYAYDMNWLVNESLLCNPKEPCLDHIPCGKLTNRFMRLWTDIPGSSAMGILPVPEDMIVYSDVRKQIGLGFDWLDFVDNGSSEGPEGPEWDYKSLFMQNLLDSLNKTFSICEEGREYSMTWFLAQLLNCHRTGKPGGHATSPCLDQLNCEEVGQAFKDFLVDNPWPDNGGYAPYDLDVYASDLGLVYDEYNPFKGTHTPDVDTMTWWLEDIETKFNELFNKCYKEGDAESVLDLEEFLQWTYMCDTLATIRYKADPCPTCYVGDTAYLNAFKNFLDDVTAKANPNYLHNSLWTLKGSSATPFDITSFYNNTTLYDNGYPDDLEYIAHEVKVPELDITIIDSNGYQLDFNLLFPTAEKKWNFGEIQKFIDIYPVKSGGCSAPNLFEIVAVYKLPNRYWDEVDKPDCPNHLGSECWDTIALLGRFRNIHIGQEVSCLGCNRLCNKPYFRHISKPERCHDGDVKLAIENAFIRYNDYFERQKQIFDSTYINKCMNSDSLNEKTRLKYEDRTYHYTLYHYDRAGSLVKTIPPAGIDFEAPDLSQIDRDLLIQDRIAKTRAFRANDANPRPQVYHTLVTQYKYNSLGELVWQQTPDGGIGKTWYDGLARPVLSENARQRPQSQPDSVYGYMLYDALGRVYESGQIDPDGNPEAAPVDVADATWLANFFSLSGPEQKTEVTQTQYDVPADDSRVSAAFVDWGGQQNIRNVVASISYEEVNDDDVTTYDQATYYTYDAMGNVDRMVQDIPDLDDLGKNLFTLDYTYDLLSGNVHKVIYQKDSADQFAHKYEYDKNNRLTHVYTSKDNYSWERDARYEYYFHGTLARTELGELNVQGMDYNYTLQGWLKTVNSPTIDHAQDIGLDGDTIGSSNAHEYVARDAFAFDLSYFDGDYAPIHGGSYGPDTADSDLTRPGNYFNLYNGNIAMMTTSLADETTYNNGDIAGDVMGNVYRYDQLNRITKHKVFENINSAQDAWLNNGYVGNQRYFESFNYDASGNITNLIRNGHDMANLEMDAFVYSYDVRNRSAVVNTSGGPTTIYWNQMETNKLYDVEDDASYSSNYTKDIDDPTWSYDATIATINDNNTYGYDALGNLERDSSSDIARIQWTATGKIKRVIRNNNSSAPDLEFGYDAFDNRLYKIVKPKDGMNALTTEDQWTKEYYIYDGSGMVMATYQRTYTEEMEVYTDHFELNQFMLYGSARLGVFNQDTTLVERSFNSFGFNEENYFDGKDYNSYAVNTVYVYQTEEVLTVRGLKQYELTNHLGNVLATIQDRKQVGDTFSSGSVSGNIAYFIPYIISTQDYYAFGSLMDERGFTGGCYGMDTTYRYGFNGQEKENDISGNVGDYLSFRFRIHDARLGRFLSVDPLAPDYPYYSVYQFASNSPIISVDVEGLESSNDPNPTTYTVKRNDTPIQIADRYGISVWALAEANQGRKMEGGGQFLSVKDDEGNYKSWNDYWVEGNGTEWTIEENDVLVIPINGQNTGDNRIPIDIPSRYINLPNGLTYPGVAGLKQSCHCKDVFSPPKAKGVAYNKSTIGGSAAMGLGVQRNHEGYLFYQSDDNVATVRGSIHVRANNQGFVAGTFNGLNLWLTAGGGYAYATNKLNPIYNIVADGAAWDVSAGYGFITGGFEHNQNADGSFTAFNLGFGFNKPLIKDPNSGLNNYGGAGWSTSFDATMSRTINAIDSGYIIRSDTNVYNKLMNDTNFDMDSYLKRLDYNIRLGR